MSDDDRKQKILELYELMERLSDENDADSACIRKADGNTLEVVLSYNVPEDRETDDDDQSWGPA